jgi:hypothetical protein
MSVAKFDPTLEAEMDQAEATGASDRMIPVLIAHAGAPVQAEEGEQLEHLERRVKELQRGIMTRLSELGAEERAQALVLANVVSADLTPAEITELAKLEDVRAIHLNRQQNVTT